MQLQSNKSNGGAPLERALERPAELRMHGQGGAQVFGWEHLDHESTPQTGTHGGGIPMAMGTVQRTTPVNPETKPPRGNVRRNLLPRESEHSATEQRGGPRSRDEETTGYSIVDDGAIGGNPLGSFDRICSGPIVPRQERSLPPHGAQGEWVQVPVKRPKKGGGRHVEASRR